MFAKTLVSGQKYSESKLIVRLYFIYLGIALKSHLMKSKHDVFDGKRKINVGGFPSCCIAKKKPLSCLELSMFARESGPCRGERELRALVQAQVQIRKAEAPPAPWPLHSFLLTKLILFFSLI